MCVSVFPNGSLCCCLEGQDSSVTASVTGRGAFGNMFPLTRLASISVSQRMILHSPPARYRTLFLFCKWNFPAVGGGGGAGECEQVKQALQRERDGKREGR